MDSVQTSPILPKSPVIYTDRQGNQLEQAINLELDGLSCHFMQEACAAGLDDYCLPTCCNGAIGSVKGSASNDLETSRDKTSTWIKDPLLALADAASLEHFPFGTNPWIVGNCTKESNWGTANAFSRDAASQFAPVTPEKGMIEESKKVTEIQNSCTYARRNQEFNKNGIASRGAGAVGLQTDQELQKQATNSSCSVFSPLLKEDHNSDKIGSDADHDLISRTPEQKPRSKKHRPKVITEGKPIRSQKSATPKSSTYKENPTGKRKYAQKKALNKASSSPPAEATGESTDRKTIEPTKKSCRRVLNFNVEVQNRDGSSTCRPAFDLDTEQKEKVSAAINQSKSTVYLGHGIEVVVENTPAGIAYDLTRSVNQMLKRYTSSPVTEAPATSFPVQTNHQQGKQVANSPEKGETIHNVQENAIQIFPTSPRNSNCSTITTLIEKGQASRSKRKHSEQPETCSINLSGIQFNSLHAYQNLPLELFPIICKKKRTGKGKNSGTSGTSSSVTAANDIVKVKTCPQKGHEGDPSIPKINCWIPAPYYKDNGLRATCVEKRRDLLYRLQTFGHVTNQTVKSTKKRSLGLTEVQDLASLTRMPRCTLHPTYSTGEVTMNCNGQHFGNSHRPQTNVELLLAEIRGTWTTKKRTKKRDSLVNSGSCSRNTKPSHGKIVSYNWNKFSAKLLGAHPEEIWKQMFSVDAIVEQLKHLDIKSGSCDIGFEDCNALAHYNIENDMQNALALYRRGDAIVPNDGSFGTTRKQRPRPKVDLDGETSRVWKLLMGNINSEGIDGTDEQNAKWWEEERTVFHGRADSFIARMHLVQGDRRFSPWKGSVLDSVIGVFLTQNVSDHLSSSAYMSLAARFPLKAINKPYCGEWTTSGNEKPIVCIPDSEDDIRWNEMPNHSTCDQSSITLQDIELGEEQDVVNSSESLGSSSANITSETGPLVRHESMVNRSTDAISVTGRVSNMVEERTAINDAISPQNSVISGQIPVYSPIAQAAERKKSCAANNSEEKYLTDGSKLNNFSDCTSFMELLHKVGSPRLHVAYSQENSKLDNLEGHKSTPQISMVESSNCYGYLTSNTVLKVDHFTMITKSTQYNNISRNTLENGMKDHSAHATESATQIADQNKLTLIDQDASKSSISNNPPLIYIEEDKHMSVAATAITVEDPKIIDSSLVLMQNNCKQKTHHLSGETTYIVEGTKAFDKQKKNPQKAMESEIIQHGYSKSREPNEMNAATRKAKSRRVGNEIRDNYDWDSLRNQAEANGKRERTAETMDSLDWEAVRCADVNEIASTIKERGMNNMLAERIKDFLNRLVREHGSIDLEWLRNIPPDKAKEYLLSIRGLGLKSVECVRLLTLHHLAFPVDTNVGRIAVRLGWVPLQPLPESLQLHLLELYPVLESIQKYLWPRLCKLDQRTLYELHYQMITFGKVFCTKSKPNCNACPMRGECRHFASAFASARLALPGPEEKGIVIAAKEKIGQNPAVKALPLPLLQTTKESERSLQSEANGLVESKSRIADYEPIIEEPSSPEPLPTGVTENEMEDTFCEDPDEIPTIKLNIEEFTHNLKNYMQDNMELQAADMSKALVALTAEAASIPIPKLKNVSRLRTEHQVYELPDSHPLLQGMDRREPDDPCSYLLAIWTPGETANSIQPPERRCSSQESGKLCDERTCFSCNNIREANSQIVRGTLLIPCRTAMRGSFPLNGTYFQVNEVFADHDSSLNPIDVPRAWIWNLPRRTVYFGTSVPTIFKGLTTEAIQQCFWRGYVCVRGFDQKTRAPRPLMARLHFPASKLTQAKKR